jgi:hypothetical protein
MTKEQLARLEKEKRTFSMEEEYQVWPGGWGGKIFANLYV